MAKMIPVPWIRWQHFHVFGVVLEAESGRPLPRLQVQAFDKDLFSDDFLGEATTDDEGRFDIGFTDADFKDAVESQPDIYLTVLAPGHAQPLHDTSYAIRENASNEEYYEIRIPAARIPSR